MNKRAIASAEVSFHPTSFCDYGGRLFWWKDELYRGIAKSNEAFVRRLFDEQTIDRLTKKGLLVPTEITEFITDEYPLVLRHEVIPFVSYGSEWCFPMLKDAALLVCDILADLAQERLLIDADTWDILFDGTRPVYVDFCSIDLDHGTDFQRQQLEDDFYSYFINPLQLMSQGCGHLARWLLADYYHDRIHAEFAAVMGKQIYSYTRKSLPDQRPTGKTFSPLIHRGKQVWKRGIRKVTGYRTDHEAHDQSCEPVLLKSKQAIEEISSAHLPGVEELQSEWLVPTTPCGEWTTKQNAVYRVLTDLNPQTVLDVGCGSGWYAKLAAAGGANVVALDRNEDVVSFCYTAARKEGQLSVLPLIMDIGRPTSGDGVCNQTIAPALQRISCDMVLALDVIHWLVLSQNYTFRQVCDTFAAVTKRWLLIEFVDQEIAASKVERTNLPSWYRLDLLCESLSSHFQVMKQIRLNHQNSVLLLCSRVSACCQDM